jgi:hypothetical protein
MSVLLFKKNLQSVIILKENIKVKLNGVVKWIQKKTNKSYIFMNIT